MQRRSFLKASIIGSSLGSIIPMISEASAKEATRKAKREFYELRVYSLKNKEQERIVEDYFEKAAIPAYNRLGCKIIGVFKEFKPESQTKIYVIIPFKSLDDMMQADEKLANDDDYAETGSGYLNAPPAEPAYEKMESSLHIAFAGMPKLILPENRPRFFELRQYESANEMAGKKKIEMFNNGGEIEVCKRVGLNPVFFGETLIGAVRPSLAYMLAFDSMSAHDRAWKWYGKDPELKKLKAIPEYDDEKIVSRITSVLLTPANCSQM